jgi:hypothetical protein
VHEALARRVYGALNDRTADTAHHISLFMARRCVERFGVELVERTLALTTSRRRVYKPVGFFMTVLRSEARFGPA